MSPATQRISGLTKKVIKKQNQGKNKKKTKNNKKNKTKQKLRKMQVLFFFVFFLFFLVFFDFSGGSSCRIVFLVIRFLIVFFLIFLLKSTFSVLHGVITLARQRRHHLSGGAVSGA